MWLENTPNCVHRTYTCSSSGEFMKSGVEWNPGTSWLQNAKPESPKCSPPFRLPAMPAHDDSLSPPQCRG